MALSSTIETVSRIEYKNALQQYCHSHQCELPVYTSTKQGTKHKPMWLSTVQLCSQSFCGNEEQTKRAAEGSAAKIALDSLDRSRPVCEVTKRTALFVDVENMPKFISRLPVFKGPMMVYAFVGAKHPLASTNYGPDVKVVTSPSTRKDGTDVCIQLHIGRSLAMDEYDVYLIATRDHFGDAAVDLITAKNFTWSEKEAKVVTSPEDVINISKA